MTIQGDNSVGTIAAEFPMATRVFARHGIDYCCGGGKTLSSVCGTRGLKTNEILAEIEHEIERETGATDGDLQRWDHAPLDDLIDHILIDYHQPLAEELPRLETMARKVLAAHGERNPEMFRDLLATVLELKSELEQHMMKEEQILFPMIRRGQGAFAGGPIEVMEAEHDSAGAALRHLRLLTDGYRVPEEACTTWRALWFGLSALEDSLHRHIHLENNILFPRALAA